MAKLGRPGVPYEKFIAVCEQLLTEGRAGVNAALELLVDDRSFSGTTKYDSCAICSGR